MTEVSPGRRVERSRWLIVALVVASACTHADGGASPSSSVAPSNGTDLQLRPVIEVVPRSSAAWDETHLTCMGRGEAIADCVAGSLDAPRIVLLSPGGDGGKYVLGAEIVDGNDVERAIAHPGVQAGAGWIVYVDLAAEGTERFETATAAAVGSQIAIIIDGRIVSAPVVSVPISSGDVVVASGLTQREATALASRLDSERT